MSYNLRDGELSVGGYDQAVTDRKVGLAKTIALKNPEIVCIQESDDLSASSLVSSCASNGTRTYTSYQPSGSTNAILWDASLYTRLAGGVVDITLDKDSEGGDGYTRTAVWIKFERKSDHVQFIVISTHFDLNKPGTSLTKMLDALADTIGSTRVVIMGDLNATEGRWVNIGQFKNLGYTNANTAYTDYLKENHVNNSDGWSGTAAGNGLAATFPSKGNILDWCYYTTGKFAKQTYEVVTTTVKWTYSSIKTLYQNKSITGNPSDHYPIYVTLTVK